MGTVRRRVAALTLGVLAASSAGCYTLDVRTAGAVPSGPTQSMHGIMLFWGLIGTDITAPCPPATVESEEGLLGVLVTVLTAGIVTPWSVEITCAAPARY